MILSGKEKSILAVLFAAIMLFWGNTPYADSRELLQPAQIETKDQDSGITLSPTISMGARIHKKSCLYSSC